MLDKNELTELINIFRNLKNARSRPASDSEKLYICDSEPVFSPITVGEVRRLIAIAKKYDQLTRL